MTKLLKWLLVTTVISSIWIAAVINSSTVAGRWRELIQFLPVILLFLFGLYAVTVVMYRTLTFNTCESAATELQLQIEEAKKDLQSKGVILRETGVFSTS